MDLGSILLLAGIFIIVLFLILRPFLEISADRKLISRAVKVDQNEQQRSVLLAERDRVLRSLNEMEFDFTLGKIPAEDYPEQRNMLLHHGAEIFKQLDGLNVETSSNQSLEEAGREVTTKKAPIGDQNNSELSETDISALIAARRREKAEKSAGFCPQCGKPVSISDKFCARCGRTL